MKNYSYTVVSRTKNEPDVALLPAVRASTGAELLLGILREVYAERWSLIPWGPEVLTDLEGVPVIPVASLFPARERLRDLDQFVEARAVGLDGEAAPFSPPSEVEADKMRPVVGRIVAHFNALRLELARRATGSSPDDGTLRVTISGQDYADDEPDIFLDGVPLRALLEDAMWWTEALLYHLGERAFFDFLEQRLSEGGAA
jgi:hypothetical protein